jgi:hypothetical protein
LNGPAVKSSVGRIRGRSVYDTIVFSELAVKFDTQKDLEHRLSAFANRYGATSRPDK